MNRPEYLYTMNDITLVLKLGDLTEQKTEVIVNAANTRLYLGSGVAGAIKTKGGSEIQTECNKKLLLNGCDFNTGDSVATGVGNFNYFPSTKGLKYIFHAIGPFYQGGSNNEKRSLSLAFKNSIVLANQLQITSISFPPISTGVFHYPKEECAKVFLEVVKEYADEAKGDLKKGRTLKEICLCIIDYKTYEVFCSVFKKYFAEVHEAQGVTSVACLS